jgi:hypothetical protein
MLDDIFYLAFEFSRPSRGLLLGCGHLEHFPHPPIDQILHTLQLTDNLNHTPPPTIPNKPLPNVLQPTAANSPRPPLNLPQIPQIIQPRHLDRPDRFQIQFSYQICELGLGQAGVRAGVGDCGVEVEEGRGVGDDVLVMGLAAVLAEQREAFQERFWVGFGGFEVGEPPVCYQLWPVVKIAILKLLEVFTAACDYCDVL